MIHDIMMYQSKPVPVLRPEQRLTPPFRPAAPCRCRPLLAEPVATLDFASLYPSIMMAHNLCYTTLLPPDRWACAYYVPRYLHACMPRRWGPGPNVYTRVHQLSLRTVVGLGMGGGVHGVLE